MKGENELAEKAEGINDDFHLIKDEMTFKEKDRARDCWDYYYGIYPYDYEVYLLMDSTKPGRYKYGPIECTHEPFYVGCGKRYIRVRESKALGRQRDKYLLKVHRMEEIINAGGYIRHQIIGCYFTETKSKLVEKKIMNLIPRNVLTNATFHFCEIPLLKEDYELHNGLLTL